MKEKLHQQKLFFFLWPGDSIKSAERGGKRGKWGGKLALLQSLEIQEDAGEGMGWRRIGRASFLCFCCCLWLCVCLKGAPLGGWVGVRYEYACA